MAQESKGIQWFSDGVSKTRDVMGFLLRFGCTLLGANQAGVIYGTDSSGQRFLGPPQWDRGIIHKCDAKGLWGYFFRWLGPTWVRMRGIMPIYLYEKALPGESPKPNAGVIAHVLRRHRDYYQRGIRILFIGPIPQDVYTQDAFVDLPMFSYTGTGFRQLNDVKINMRIVRSIKPLNFLSAYIPDYGAIVFDTIFPEFNPLESNCIDALDQDISLELKEKLDTLIQAIDLASIHLLKKAKGESASALVQRKEKHLRLAWQKFKEKEKELFRQKKWLRALGGISSGQMDMEPVSVGDGSYAFIDMVGSVGMLSHLLPRDYFFMLGLCHEMAANLSHEFGCRLDNFIGDSVFVENVSIFDGSHFDVPPEPHERLMLMVMLVASFFDQVQKLKMGIHPMDKEGRVKFLLERHGVDIQFRAGLESGDATIGPLGSAQRRVITAVGSAVNTASRLEQTGRPNMLHVKEGVMDILNRANVSKQTPILGDLLEDGGGPASFFEFFQSFFQLDSNPIRLASSVSYKEFSQDQTFLIHCLPKINIKVVNF